MSKSIRFPTERSAGHKLRHVKLAIDEMLRYKRIDVDAVKRDEIATLARYESNARTIETRVDRVNANYSEHADRLRLPLSSRC